ncbi:MAG TPA: hypothetical protein VNK04_24625, partial [Gemmataceae bacterium]|nr:hypothetical protein [Gemmataceae bacterium]
MQGWEIWLVPLIAMAVWILGSLLRGGLEERQRDNLPRPGPGGGPEGGRPSRPVSDLERFLEEVHRRRQAAAEKRERESPREPPSSSPERVESRPRPRSVPAPVRPPPPPRRPPRPAPPPVAR